MSMDFQAFKFDFFTISLRSLVIKQLVANSLKQRIFVDTHDSHFVQCVSPTLEKLIKSGGVPYTILSATQFFEFMGAIAQSATDGQTVRLPSAFIQPVMSDDVAAALVDITLGEPVNGIVELAGPNRFHFDELIRRFLSANHDPRQVVTDTHARYYGTELDDRTLIPGDNSLIGSTRFEDWLSRSLVQR